ncbi:TetR family transcriptional regulator [Scandinavium sp. V105_16]|uniref:TetR family transcriptional regulator n=1 Tax=Scandinavium lactucae TaxID=3095028 RepID=A0AAJ2S4H3_9ENTR|nr:MULTISPECIES: TetR family transcriptional regulator [unclassified Scandinavium]MDX6022299.1 TetR family transcriptional regulator [Scandinavium sp. V105_16]MDX6033859.1 TetR family transcriptional regulator [Scandinavium sp. V105_12]MDX6042292.1 TetR family transcriptional regulator [Scandinavium sp. V105_6]MDX6052293.1 TetR family transcriptional regulator [Scandinavium sp. V105_1]
MSYLNREERRETIMQAAIQVALEEGFSAMTVRNIATRAGIAAGQVHHHFTSSGELRSQAFVRVIRDMMALPLVPENASWRERLFSMLGSEDRRLEPYIRLWRQAQLLADSDPEIKAAYLLTMSMWHGETVRILLAGQQAGEFTLRDSANDIAWRLIALVCGMDGIYVLGMAEVDDAAFSRHLQRAITLELF